MEKRFIVNHHPVQFVHGGGGQKIIQNPAPRRAKISGRRRGGAFGILCSIMTPRRGIRGSHVTLFSWDTVGGDI